MNRWLLVALFPLALRGEAMAQSASSTAPAAPPPACSGPEFRQLDFWVGDWDATWDAGDGHKGHATNRITKDEYGDCVITEHFEEASTGWHGHSVSMYDGHGHWRQTWVDSQGSYISLVGGPVTGQRHIFEFHVIRKPEAPPLTRMIWEDVKRDGFTWRWQGRKTESEPWTDKWVIDYTRRK